LPVDNTFEVCVCALGENAKNLEEQNNNKMFNCDVLIYRVFQKI